MADYDLDFHPAYKPGHTLKCHHGTGLTNVRVDAVRSMGTHEHDWGALTLNTLSVNNQCVHLQVQDGEIAQYRFLVMFPGWAFLKHPASTNFLSSKSMSPSTGNIWGINQWEADRSQAPVISGYDFASSQFWVWQDDDPRFELLPLKSAVGPVPQGYVHFKGWRYKVTPIDYDGEVDLWMDTWPGK